MQLLSAGNLAKESSAATVYLATLIDNKPVEKIYK